MADRPPDPGSFSDEPLTPDEQESFARVIEVAMGGGLTEGWEDRLRARMAGERRAPMAGEPARSGQPPDRDRAGPPGDGGVIDLGLDPDLDPGLGPERRERPRRLRFVLATAAASALIAASVALLATRQYTNRTGMADGTATVPTMVSTASPATDRPPSSTDSGGPRSGSEPAAGDPAGTSPTGDGDGDGDGDGTTLNEGSASHDSEPNDSPSTPSTGRPDNTGPTDPDATGAPGSVIEVATPDNSTVAEVLGDDDVLALAVTPRTSGWLVLDVRCDQPPSLDLAVPYQVRSVSPDQPFWQAADPVDRCADDVAYGQVEAGQTYDFELALADGLTTGRIQLVARVLTPPIAPSSLGRVVLVQPEASPSYSVRRWVPAGTIHSFGYSVSEGQELNIEVRCDSEEIRLRLVATDGSVAYDETIAACSAPRTTPALAAGAYELHVLAPSVTESVFYSLGPVG